MLRPRQSAETLGALLGDARRLARPHEVAAVQRNLRQLGCDPHSLPGLVRRTFQAFGLFAVEFFHGLSMTPDQIARGWRIHGWHHLEELAASPYGFIMVGAHTGNWEHLSALAPLIGRRIVAPTDLQFHPWLSPAVGRIKLRRGVESVSPQRSPRFLLRALASGKLVAIPLDGGSYRGGFRVPLRGSRVRLAAGAVRLAVLSGRPLLPVFSLRTGFMQQDVLIQRPIFPPGRNSHKQAVQACALQLAELLGEQLRRAAGQWCIFRPLPWYD